MGLDWTNAKRSGMGQTLQFLGADCMTGLLQWDDFTLVGEAPQQPLARG
jgi:hypothetical protein